MQDVNHTLKVIGEKLELPELILNGDGQAEVVFTDDVSAYITKIDETNMELSFRLDDLDSSNPAIMRIMLEANFLGTATGAGRLAIDASSNETIYCERWDVTEINSDQADMRFAAFANAATFWATEGTDTLLEELQKNAPNNASSAPVGGENILRV